MDDFLLKRMKLLNAIRAFMSYTKYEYMESTFNAMNNEQLAEYLGGLINSSKKPYDGSFVDKEIQSYLLKRIQSSSVTDKIKMTSKEDAFIIDLWTHGLDKHNLTIPSDLFFAKTIPLLDCEISISDEKATIKYRVVVFDDYADIIERNTASPACVGVLILNKPFETDIYIPLLVIDGCESLAIDQRSYVLSREATTKIFLDTMATWYGIQIALLHPTIKEVFLHPSTASNSEMKRRERNEKRHVKYVKKHIVNIDDLIRCAEKTKRIKKCLAWYVIGHWRHYKDGKQIFVKPYWKGALRELKGNAGEEARERDMDFSIDKLNR